MEYSLKRGAFLQGNPAGPMSDRCPGDAVGVNGRAMFGHVERGRHTGHDNARSPGQVSSVTISYQPASGEKQLTVTGLLHLGLGQALTVLAWLIVKVPAPKIARVTFSEEYPRRVGNRFLGKFQAMPMAQLAGD